jgi:hypothetical protein
MRVAVFALLVCAGTAAFCQPSAPAPAVADKLTPSGQAATEPARDFSKGPVKWKMDFSAQPKTILVLEDGPSRRAGAQIDPQMIVHPPQSRIGEQPPGTPVAQNLYPGLRFLPIGESKLKAQPIPTRWPDLKVEGIPTVWPKLEVKPTENGTGPTGDKR